MQTRLNSHKSQQQKGYLTCLGNSLSQTHTHEKQKKTLYAIIEYIVESYVWNNKKKLNEIKMQKQKNL